MAEKLDLRKFYQDTLPSTENITRLYDISNTKETYTDRSKYLSASNESFGMLAHLNLTTFTTTDISHLLKLLGSDNFDSLDVILRSFKIIKTHPSTGLNIFNPSAVPMIKRYRKVFNDFEKQNGLTSFYKQKEGKEPGDN